MDQNIIKLCGISIPEPSERLALSGLYTKILNAYVPLSFVQPCKLLLNHILHGYELEKESMKFLRSCKSRNFC